jgi:hypothetical protein
MKITRNIFRRCRLKNRYKVIKTECTDWRILCVIDNKSNTVLCHFLTDTKHNFDEKSKIADKICDFLNKK